MKPRYLTQCPNCGEPVRGLTYAGVQTWPQRMKNLPRHERYLLANIYPYVHPDEFGYDLFSCSACQSTFADLPHEEE